MLNKKTVVVGHKYTTTPEDYLVEFLKERDDNKVLQIRHAFSDTPNRISDFTLYENKNVVKTGQSKDWLGKPEPLIYLKELAFTVSSVFESKQKWETYVGIDGLCVFFGIILRTLGKVDQVVYWAMDYVPNNRFGSGLKNFIYKSINTFAYKKADEVWDLSPRMAEAREKFSGLKMDSYKKIKVVPYGVWVQRIKKYSYDECEKNTLVFMGHILEKMGAQKVIEAIPLIVKEKPDFKFKVIGGGEYLDKLKQLAINLKVEEYCNFLGKIPDHSQLENEIAKCCVAIAPYVKELDTWTYFADPGKIKEYLASGLPVLLTDLPWNTQEIVEKECGKVITTEPNIIAENVLEMMKPEINQKYRENAVKYAQTFDQAYIFNQLIQ